MAKKTRLFVSKPDTVRAMNTALAALANAQAALHRAVEAEGEADQHGLADAVEIHTELIDRICADLDVRTPNNAGPRSG